MADKSPLQAHATGSGGITIAVAASKVAALASRVLMIARRIINRQSLR
jgi:hypothetical protein